MIRHKKSVPPENIGTQTGQSEDVQFLGWQKTVTGDIFPLYNIVKNEDPSYGFTVTEETLYRLHFRVPRTPSPFPEAPPSRWHNFGTTLSSPATSREAIESAGLNYTVVKKPLNEVVVLNNPADVTDCWATVRTDTGDVLGIVSDSYQPVQNADAFRFFDHLVSTNDLIYETAGSFNGGESVWLLAKLPGYIKVDGKDLVSKYLLLTNSHDGSTQVQMKITPIRVICNNTLTAALKGAGEITIRPSVNITEEKEQAQSLLGLSQTMYQQLDDTFKRMALTRISNKQLLEYVNALVPDNNNKDAARNQVIRNTCLHLYESGHGADLSRGTLWGAFNCVTEYTDHIIQEDSYNQPESSQSVNGERLTRRAFQLAERMMMPTPNA